MGPLPAHVCLCFREIVIVTSQILYLSCSLDIYLLRIVIFVKSTFQNGAYLENSAKFDLLFTFFSHKEKVTKIPSAHSLIT